jgi:hypothetical protein
MQRFVCVVEVGPREGWASRDRRGILSKRDAAAKAAESAKALPGGQGGGQPARKLQRQVSWGGLTPQNEMERALEAAHRSHSRQADAAAKHGLLCAGNAELRKFVLTIQILQEQHGDPCARELQQQVGVSKCPLMPW